MTTPGQTLGVSVFLDYIIDDLHISRSLTSLFYTVGTLLGSFILPYVGREIDKRGPRMAAVVISLLFSAACIWMGFIFGPISLLIGFVLIRGLGQGSLGLVSNYVVNIWFIRYRGLAVGLSGLGFAIAAGFFPYLIELLICGFGWRGAYIILGFLVAGTMIPVAYLFFRSHPENYGLYPDGVGPVESEEFDLSSGYTLAEARRTALFIVFATGDFLVSALSTGLIFHHYSIMEAGGIGRLAAAAFFLPMGFTLAGGNVFSGYLMDRIPPRFLLSALQILQVAAVILAIHVLGHKTVFAYGLLLGLIQGIKNGVMGSVHAYYFGRAHIGSIRGFATTISVAGSAFGPLFFAIAYDSLGSYDQVLYFSALLPLAIAVIAVRLKPTSHRAPER